MENHSEDGLSVDCYDRKDNKLIFKDKTILNAGTPMRDFRPR